LISGILVFKKVRADTMPEQTGEISTEKATPPYVAFSTFLNAIERLKAHGVPNQIDRSIWPSFSGAIQSQLMGAFKFLRLVADDGAPTKNLRVIVGSKDEENLKSGLLTLMKHAYPTVIAIDLEHATMRQLSESILELGVSGETAKKAMAFFLKAAKYCDLPLSVHLHARHRKGLANGAARKGATRKRSKPAIEQESDELPPSGGESLGGEVLTLQLPSGATIKFGVDKPVIQLPKEDRDFIMQLVDQMQLHIKGKTEAQK